jgi:hypothetical protein
VQKVKSQFVYKAQGELEVALDKDSMSFWRKIGKTAIGNKRHKKIPFEVRLYDGSISSYTMVVFQKWD